MKKVCALTLVIVSLMGLCMLSSQPTKADSKTITVPDDFLTIVAAVGNATDGDTILVKKGTYEEDKLVTNKSLSFVGEGVDLTRIKFIPPSRWVTFDNGLPEPFKKEERVQVWDAAIVINADNIQFSAITIVSLGDAFVAGEGVHISDANITVPATSVHGFHSNIARNALGTSLLVNGSYAIVTENSLNSLSINGSHSIASRNAVLGGIGMIGDYCEVSENVASGSSSYGSGMIRLTGSHYNVHGNYVKGIDVQAYSCFIHENNVTEDKNDGRVTIGGDGNIVTKNFIDHLAFGVELKGSGNIICGNRITRNGIGLLESGRSNIIYANQVANNGWGIETGYKGMTAVLYDNNFVDNTIQVSTLYKEYEIDFFDNGTRGNYWSDYNGTDANHDGIGDVPYGIDVHRSDRYPLLAPFDTNNLVVESPEWISTLVSPSPSTSPQPASLAQPPSATSSASVFSALPTVTPSPSDNRLAVSSEPAPLSYSTGLVIALATAIIIVSIISIAVVLRRGKR